MALTIYQRGVLTRQQRSAIKRYTRAGRPLEVPDHVLAERERRYQLTPCDLTALLLGDPLPGFSALDGQRRADGPSLPPGPSVGRGARQLPRPNPCRE